MDIMKTMRERAKVAPQRVAFPEATNEKILAAARQCADERLCVPILVGSPADIEAASTKYGVPLGGLMVVDAFNKEWLEKLVGKYTEKFPANSTKTMMRVSKDPLYVALMLQAVGSADLTFAGIDHTTGDIILAGTMVIGLQQGVTCVSSVSILDIPGYDGSEGTLLGFGDSAVCVNPDAEELARIAIAACDTLKALMEWEPRCAMLSYSTCGSGEGPMVDKVVEAVKIANDLRPDLAIDGEFQFDAAINPKIAAKKVMRESKVAGKANIVIWPDLNTGNIGVKLVQQLSQVDAYGPMLQGFAKIVCDCSRGAPVSEIVGTVAISCVRAQESK